MTLNQIVQKSVLQQKSVLKSLLVFSFFINLLLLVPSWYMLQVYDRVIMSMNMTTLLMLALLTVVLIWVMEKLYQQRAALLYVCSQRIEQEYLPQLFELSFKKAQMTNRALNPSDLDYFNRIIIFIRSNTLTALIDLPFAILFLIIVYSMNIALGHLTLCFTIVLAIIAYLNERAVHPKLFMANSIAATSQATLNNVVRNAEVIQAMGMKKNMLQRWLQHHYQYLSYQSSASLSAGFYQSVSKLLQQLLGSAILGVGCWLFLTGHFSLGASGIIVASIIATRFTAPMIQAISGWKNVSNARDGYRKILEMEKLLQQQTPQLQLPAPKGLLQFENVSLKLPQTERFILKQINFALKPGQSLALIGASGSGKTSLAKLAVGVLPADLGQVRLDGAELYHWPKQQVGQYVGYLPQEVVLYTGSIAQNVSRFNDTVDAAALNQVIELVGLTDFIHSLPDGINTQLNSDMALPGGKRQLIGLARAMYGLPKLVVLDEPGSNLDKQGKVALCNCLEFLKVQGCTVLVSTHQKSLLHFSDYIMVLMHGEVRLSGSRDDVLKKLNGNATNASAGENA